MFVAAAACLVCPSMQPIAAGCGDTPFSLFTQLFGEQPIAAVAAVLLHSLFGVTYLLGRSCC